MRLVKIELRPFAGFAGAAFSFAPGLNVVLGANDRGKSSLFRAIESALFLPSKASRSTREGRDLLPRVLPLGSDQARISLELAAGSGSYRLEKSWGQGASISLEGPGGLRLSQEDKVEEALRALLPVPPATFQSVLLVGQGALEGTVRALEERRDALHSLGDLLRVTVDKTAGLSVDRLKEALRRETERSFQHWDRATNLPEKGKGIEDPWLKNVGLVLAAYYGKERARRDAALARALEGERDRKLAELSVKQAAREEARAFVRRHEQLVAGLAGRRTLEARRAKAAAESSAKTADLTAWMQAASHRDVMKPEVERLQSARTKLDEELSRLLGRAKELELLARHERVQAAKASWEESRKRLEGLPPFRPEDLRRIRQAAQELEALRAGLKAGKIQLQLTLKKDLDVLVRKDLDPERRGLMPAGNPMTLNAGGRVQLSSELFDLQVTTGDGRVNELEEKIAGRSDALGKLLAEKKVASVEEAQERADTYAEATSLAKAAESALAALLAGDKIEELERLVRQAREKAPAVADRAPEAVKAELAELLRDLEKKRDKLVAGESLVADLSRRHKAANVEELTEQMVQAKTELSEVERALAQLPPLPPEAGSAEELLERFEAAKGEAERLGDRVRDLSVEVEAIKGRLATELGGESAQDLERGMGEAEAAFTRELARGRALLRVEAAVQAVEGEGNVYAGFQEAFARQVAALSAGRYASVRMTDSLPTDFQREDGALVPYGWLSAGTKDAFALALRLAMAEHFLGESEGFLLVDDPLVNMDPERQKTAAACLREIASRRQLVVFTCHPAHAELLGGNRIGL